MTDTNLTPMDQTELRLRARFGIPDYDVIGSPKAVATRITALTLDKIRGGHSLSKPWPVDAALSDPGALDTPTMLLIVMDLEFKTLVFALVSGMLECLTTEAA